MAGDARHEWIVGSDGRAGRLEEGGAFGACEEECFGVGAEDDEACFYCFTIMSLYMFLVWMMVYYTYQ